MFQATQALTAAIETADQDAGETGYRTPELRSAGSAVQLVQGYSWMSGYDMCGHGIYECE